MNLLGGALIWSEDAPRPSEDAFWLASSVPLLPKGTTVLDAGCGEGAVGLALLTRMPTLTLTQLDTDSAALAHAQTNAQLNNRKVTFLHQPISAPAPQRYAVIICNPPFHATAKGHTAATPRKRLAHGLPPEGLASWVNALHSHLAPQGKMYLILHASLQAELIALTKPLGGTLNLAPLATHATRPAKRLLAQWGPDKALPFQLKSAEVVPAHHTPLRVKVLKEGAPLALWV